MIATAQQLQPQPEKKPMSDQQVVVRPGGIGFGGLLAILFIGLKLGGVIDWSWWWVLSPLWIPLALILAVVAVCFLIAGLATLVGGVLSSRSRSRRRR